MGAIYLGFTLDGSCVFATNDCFGAGREESAIVEVNRSCGALVITTRGDFLRRFSEIWNRRVGQAKQPQDGLSRELAEAIVNSFEAEFRKDPAHVKSPLPFLLLLIGSDTRERSSLKHIFVRNRVLTASAEGEEKEYTTGFEIREPVPAESLFYGHSELARYWFELFGAGNLTPLMMKLIACIAVAETQKLDVTIYPGIRMAFLSGGEGFRWVEEDELRGLTALASEASRIMSEGVSRCFASVEERA